MSCLFVCYFCFGGILDLDSKEAPKNMPPVQRDGRNLATAESWHFPSTGLLELDFRISILHFLGPFFALQFDSLKLRLPALAARTLHFRAQATPKPDRDLWAFCRWSGSSQTPAEPSGTVQNLAPDVSLSAPKTFKHSETFQTTSGTFQIPSELSRTCHAET